MKDERQRKLMEELKQIADISSPHEILYIADGMTGQDAVNSSSSFNQALEISGVIFLILLGSDF